MLTRSLPVALDGNVGLETPELLAADDDRLNGKGSRKADRRPLLPVASSMTSSDMLCRCPRDDEADDGSLLDCEVLPSVLYRDRPLPVQPVTAPLPRQQPITAMALFCNIVVINIYKCFFLYFSIKRHF